MVVFNHRGKGPSVSQPATIKVRFHVPPEDLRRYFTTFYITDIDVPVGETLLDTLQPEWANLRFFSGGTPDSWIDDAVHLVGTDFTVSGPSSRSINFKLGATRLWGIGLLPLGCKAGRRACQPDRRWSPPSGFRTIRAAGPQPVWRQAR
jgi:hypothetical protein